MYEKAWNLWKSVSSTKILADFPVSVAQFYSFLEAYAFIVILVVFTQGKHLCSKRL